MEACAQCGVVAEVHPVVIIMHADDAEKTHADTAVIDCDPGGTWAALPVCAPCHQAPRLKGHFFMRNDAPLALRMANFHNVQMPGRR